MNTENVKNIGVRLRRIQGQVKGIEKWCQEKYAAGTS